MVFESASFLLQDLLEEVLTTMGPIADQHGIALQLVDCDIDIQVNADAVRLGQILLNLASNAVKFNRDGGRVTIGSRLAADQVVIDVTDTGIGIPKVELANIFEEFNQLNQTSARARSGTGLGLTLSRRLARGMGGTVEVKSQMGVGSTFTISLPSGAPATQEEQAPTVRTAARVAAADEGVVAALPIA